MMKIKRIRTTLVMIGFLAAGAAGSAQSDTSLVINRFTAKQAVDYALKNAVQVKDALLDIQLQQQTNKGITAMALPQLSASASLVDYLSIPTSLIPAQFLNPNAPANTFVPIKFGTKYNGTYGAALQQVLFDGQVFAGLQARKTSIDYYVKKAEVTEELIKANVYKIYYQLIVGRRQIGTISANIDSYQKLLSDTRQIFKNGFAEQLDVDKVQVQLNNLQTQQLSAQNTIDAGTAGLKYLMNMPQKDSLVLTDSLSDEQIKSDVLDESYSYQDRKDFQLLGLSSKLETFNIRRYQLSKIPSLSLSANLNQNAQRTTFDFFKSGLPYFTTSYVSLSLTVPIFDGGLRNSNIAHARISLRQIQNDIDQLRASIDNDVSQSRIVMKSALITMDSQKKNIELAQNVYNQTKLKYDQGVGSNQEINTAQTELITAQNNYYSAIYDAIIAKINFLQATGKL